MCPAVKDALGQALQAGLPLFSIYDLAGTLPVEYLPHGGVNVLASSDTLVGLHGVLPGGRGRFLTLVLWLGALVNSEVATKPLRRIGLLGEHRP